MAERHPIPLIAQPHDDVLLVNPQASVDHLYDTAARRLNAVEDLLRLLESKPDCALVDEVARLASALAPLLSESRQLFELALDQHSRKSAGLAR
ncbi:hypothetical protein NK553_16260 [Pseudomonas sp. ZM23]|uniref:Short-chain dehydrogenase n=1 Tax=Pseudomonas triclosanedens TaxID=2961893 RepID=A0ABY7A4D3_9PSED|nr:hypothetical protein [Pseudomonas triclosanedens]MCP8465502.1 hypothetical protein [Pseudomonas triclosanedens]MCP8470997.1 hypothetical protein [Pseudomonas triclosanedens]MCP8476801.1 hypothetical protein [Pseudomonas triclosanedens]WAI52082.1 hypothetical protein OU419_12785 [Pseudomonas triclosanedens]